MACPKCRGNIAFDNDVNCCSICGEPYPNIVINTGDEREVIVDFRIKPTQDSEEWKQWEASQEEYIKYHNYYAANDHAAHYLKEIDSVKEIYRQEFQLTGRILDVGGAQGRLRHFLHSDELENYICIDPFSEAFSGFGKMKEMLNVYSHLNQCLYFMAGYAEALPFKEGSFDWVHLRSVLDHFSEPELALKEAGRVLKTDGKLLIGVSIKKGEWLKGIPKKPLWVRILKKISTLFYSKPKSNGFRVGENDHTFEWSYEELKALLKKCGFVILKEHRQKAPYSYCIYLSAGK